MQSASSPLEKLERTIAARAASPVEKSYTSRLLTAGLEKIGEKVLEESQETVEAALEPDAAGREHFIREVADLVYHLLVLMQLKGCTLANIETELGRRFGVSGLEEKASRPKKKGTERRAGAVAKKTVKKKVTPRAASRRRK